MRLPERLDYDEVHDYDLPDDHPDQTWWPLVRCTVEGCDWTYDAWWDDMADDGAADWDALHPAHGNAP